jgi:hypothetical protein
MKTDKRAKLQAKLAGFKKKFEALNASTEADTTTVRNDLEPGRKVTKGARDAMDRLHESLEEMKCLSRAIAEVEEALNLPASDAVSVSMPVDESEPVGAESLRLEKKEQSMLDPSILGDVIMIRNYLEPTGPGVRNITLGEAIKGMDRLRNIISKLLSCNESNFSFSQQWEGKGFFAARIIPEFELLGGLVLGMYETFMNKEPTKSDASISLTYQFSRIEKAIKVLEAHNFSLTKKDQSLTNNLYDEQGIMLSLIDNVCFLADKKDESETTISKALRFQFDRFIEVLNKVLPDYNAPKSRFA